MIYNALEWPYIAYNSWESPVLLLLEISLRDINPPLDAHKSLRTSDLIPVIEPWYLSEIKGSTPECSDSFRYEEGFTLLSLWDGMF